MAKQPGNTPSQMAANQRSMFQLTGGGYDIDKVYSHSTDGKGHYERMRTKITPTMEAQLSEMVASKQFDYRTVEDFVRDACVHRLHYLSTQQPRMTDVVTHEMMLADIMRERMEIERWSEIIKLVTETGETMLANGALEELGDILTRYDQDFTNWRLPIVKQYEMRELLDTLHDRLKRARRRDYQH